jgi:putative endonuclease
VLGLTDARRALGAQGEELAAQWYLSHGAEVLARNWRCREGEIDLVVRVADRLVFCEVKARTSDRFGGPAAAVTPIKQARLRRLATRWLAENNERAAGLRFDVAVVEGPASVRVIESAF